MKNLILFLLILSGFATIANEPNDSTLSEWSISCEDEDGNMSFLVVSEEGTTLECQEADGHHLAIRTKNLKIPNAYPELMVLSRKMIHLKHPNKEVLYSLMEIREYQGSYQAITYYQISGTEETGKVEVAVNK